MSRFSIEFLPIAADATPHASTRFGVIKIGDFEERFEVSTEFWTPARYESQWAEALSRLGPNSPKSCLITSITDPATANFLFWWPTYLVGQSLHFQNHVLFFSELKGTFDPNNPYPHIPDRSTTSETGEQISEWVIPFSDVVGAKKALLDVSSPLLIAENPVRL